MRFLVAGATLLVMASVAPPAHATGPTEDPLARARRAANEVSFVGEVELRWEDAAGPHAEKVGVRGSGGSIEVTGTNTVMADAGRARLVRHREGDWDLLWASTSATEARPDPSPKYETAESGTAVVASRPARVVEVRQRGVVLQRLALDDATGVLLRRDQLGPEGEVVRSMAFTSFLVTGPFSPLRTPVGGTDRVARSIPAAEVPSPFTAPALLSEGYRRIGVYREGGVVHVLYSDGLYDLSVFEQRGRLARDDLPPGGTRVGVGRRPGWVYGWQGGHVLVWHAGRTVYTLVSDAPVEHLVDAARSFPVRTHRASLVDRFRRVAASLVTR